MSVVQLESTAFEEVPLATLEVDGRPAWPAVQIATALRCDPARFQARVTTEWLPLFVPGHDYAVLVGPDLDVVREAAPDAVDPDAKGAMVLFESGVLLALARTAPECGTRLREHLRAQVPTWDGPVVTEFDLRVRREERLAGTLDYHDRRLRYGALRVTAIELHAGGFVGAETYKSLLVRACEIALGCRLPELDPTDDWSTVAQLAERTGATEAIVLSSASAMRLLDAGPEVVRRSAVRQKRGWGVSFAFAPLVAAQLETVVANRVADRAAQLNAA